MWNPSRNASRPVCDESLSPSGCGGIAGIPCPGAKLAWATLLMIATRNRAGRIVPEYAKASNASQGGQLNLSDKYVAQC